jgi:Zn-dependent M16 (insulinase) family peptidase
MQVLQATNEDIQALAPLMESILASDNICVIGSEEKIEADQDLFMEVKELF